jgi:hypothetical protein
MLSVRRHELTEEEWEQIAPLIPKNKRPAVEERGPSIHQRCDLVGEDRSAMARSTSAFWALEDDL